MRQRTSLFRTESGRNYLLPFILVTLCFALWGFANDITNPMVKAFSRIFRMSVTEGAMVQLAFYGGYFAMALPAALFIRRFSYKSGLVIGLGLYALGALLFIPAKMTALYPPFLIAYFIMTCGLSFLETSANPYVLSMGPRESATRRLNLAQAFNPIGSLMGMYVAMEFIQSRLDPMDSAARAQLGDAEFNALLRSDLDVLVGPYLVLGIVIAVIFFCFVAIKMPGGESSENDKTSLKSSFVRLSGNRSYREGRSFSMWACRSCAGPSSFSMVLPCSWVKACVRQRQRCFRKGTISLQWFFSAAAGLSAHF